MRFRPPVVRPDADAVLHLTYGDPHATDASVPLRGTGDTVEAQFLPHVFRGGTWAQTPELDLAGLDAFDLVADYTTSTKGYAVEAKTGHITIVVDRKSRELVGAAIACPDASAASPSCGRANGA